MNDSRCRKPARFAGALIFSLLLTGGTGCSIYRNLGTGPHLDAPQEHDTSQKRLHSRDMIVEVTTDAAGAVVSVQFLRSSGEDTVDAYVASTIRSNWPSVPSRTVRASLTFYSMSEGFSQPKMISSRPAS